MKRTAAILSLLCLLLPLLTSCSEAPAPESSSQTAQTQASSAATEPVSTAQSAATEPSLPEESLSPAEQERLAFYDTFWELEPESTDAWLEKNPDVFQNGYAGISVNCSRLDEEGLELWSTEGDQVLAIDAENGILILRVWIDNSRGVLAIAKDPSRLHLYPSSSIGAFGEKIPTIAERHKGLLAMTGSGFIDENGNGNGGILAGACRCDGVDYGTPYGAYYVRVELHKDDSFHILPAVGAFSEDCTDAMEFQPALLIEGEYQDPGRWVDANPRACIGQTYDGEILMLGVEGRFADSPGCPVRSCAELLHKYHGYNAINVDGGSTAMVWYRGEPIMRCSNVNAPQGRYLPNAWVYVND